MAKIQVNRAPVLTLWAAVVAERLGYDRDTALTLGRGVAGLNAQSKGQRLGIFEKPEDQEKEKETKAEKPSEQLAVVVLGRRIPTIRTEQGLRAAVKDKPIDPKSVRRYLESKFSDDLDDVQAAMEALAKAYKPDKLAAQAYALYEEFRPRVPEGKRGWGAMGELDLGQIRSMARQKK